MRYNRGDSVGDYMQCMVHSLESTPRDYGRPSEISTEARRGTAWGTHQATYFWCYSRIDMLQARAMAMIARGSAHLPGSRTRRLESPLSAQPLGSRAAVGPASPAPAAL